MNNKNSQSIEFAPFTLAKGVDEPTLIAASDALQNEFLNQQEGFIKRHLVRARDGRWADIIYWESRESVERAMQTAPTNPAALRYFQLMANTGENDPSAENTLLSVTKSYP